VVPRVSTLSDDYDTTMSVSLNLAQIFQDESVAFFMDGDWLDNVVSHNCDNQRWETRAIAGYEYHFPPKLGT